MADKRKRKESEIEMFSINQKKVKGQIDDIFGYARQEARDYNQKFNEDVVRTLKTTVAATKTAYAGLYDSLEDYHIKYLNGVLKREQEAAKRVAQMWGRAYSDVGLSGFSKTGKYNTDSKNIFSGIDKIYEKASINVKDATKDLDKKGSEFAKKFWDIMSKTLSTVFLKPLEQGVRKYSNAYESSYSEIAGRMGTDRNGTRSYYSGAMDLAGQRGLGSAINYAGDLIPAMQAVARQGLQGDAAIRKAVDDSTAKLLLPWLQTASEAWVNMSVNMDQHGLNILKSQQLQLQNTQSGNRLLQSGVVDTLIQEMEPLMRSIDYNTGGAATMSGEAQAIMLQLVDNGLTEKEAYSAVSELVKVRSNTYSALTSGSVSQKLMAMSMENGGDLIDAYMQNSGLAGRFQTSLQKGAAQSVLGIGPYVSSLNLDDLVVDEDSLRSLAEEIGKDSSKYEQSLKDINQKVTATQQYTNKLENTTASTVGQWITAIPGGDKWFDAVLQILQSISLGSIGNLLKGNGGGFSGLRNLVTAGKGIVSKGGSAISGIGKVAGTGLSKLGGGLASGTTGSVGSGLVTLGGTAAGATELIYGGIEAGKDFAAAGAAKTGDSRRGILATTGGLNAAGAVAGGVGAASMVALGSNPVGWALIAAGGLSIAMAAIIKHLNRQSKITQQLNTVFDEQREVMKEEQKVRIEHLKSLKDEIKSLETVESKRSVLVSEGILTEAEAHKMSAGEIEAYTNNLTNQQEKIDEKANPLYDKLQSINSDLMESQVNSASDAMLDDFLALLESGDRGTINKRLLELGFSESEARVYSNLQDYERAGVGTVSARSQFIQRWKGRGMNHRATDVLDTQAINAYNAKYGGNYHIEDSEELAQKSKEYSTAVAELQTMALQYTSNSLSESLKSKVEDDISIVQDFISANGRTYTDKGGTGAEIIRNGVEALGLVDARVPQYATGTPFVKEDELAVLHQGERVLTRAENMNFNQSVNAIHAMGSGLQQTIINLVKEKSEQKNQNEDVVVAINTAAMAIIDALKMLNDPHADTGYSKIAAALSGIFNAPNTSAINLQNEMG